ncbi:hypothetical protein GE061_019404 [Apolygus lucorum]|uniref:Uncharacterized protein n=1 Tax=Apolygus lucorum TaxID=248454 RepID=A0A6A4JN89_APOLU|nr:hypothetical protein GE061_019404 [Apolygus lucorum]
MATTTQRKNEYKTDLKKLSKPQLQELLERQKKLAANSKALQRLPDKGAKILNYTKEVEDELEKREKEYDISDALAGLTLKQLDRLEWTRDKEREEPVEIEEKDDTNPFKILATHSGAGFHKKEIREEPKVESLVTERDLDDLYAINLCHKLDKVTTQDKFRPYKSLNTVKQVSKKERDLSAATPPQNKYSEMKTVGLEDSLKLMIHENEKLREIQMQHAAERLKDKTHVIGDTLPSLESTKFYRETIEPDEENEVRDECEGHDGGDVRFTIDFEEVD